MSKKFRDTGLKVMDDFWVPGGREIGEPIRKIGTIDIDRSVFQHSAKERELLKLAKLQNKIDELRKK